MTNLNPIRFGEIYYFKRQVPQDKTIIKENNGTETSAAKGHNLNNIALEIRLFFWGAEEPCNVWITNSKGRQNKDLSNYLKAVDTEERNGKTGVASGKEWLKAKMAGCDDEWEQSD